MTKKLIKLSCVEEGVILLGPPTKSLRDTSLIMAGSHLVLNREASVVEALRNSPV